MVSIGDIRASSPPLCYPLASAEGDASGGSVVLFLCTGAGLEGSSIGKSPTLAYSDSGSREGTYRPARQ